METHNQQIKLKLRFITNPISGTKSKIGVAAFIQANLNHAKFDYEIVNTEYSGHATILAQDAAQLNYYAVIAVGGDGTVNEVAKGLVHSHTALGIIPYGSGNGFAYHLGIKRDIKKAIDIINNGNIVKIDTGTANNNFFINVAGIGLDAKVAYVTKLNTKRGFFPYFYNTIKESWQFKYLKLNITTKEKSWDGEYAMAVVANGSIYGYDFSIAPIAKLDDGLFDVVLIKRAPVFAYFFLVPRMILKSLHKSSLIEYIKTPYIKIKIADSGFYHVDGEGFTSDLGLECVMKEDSLFVLSMV